MNLADLTPCILTYNEEPNIARCLARLGWASQILVVDSGSIDRTLELIAACPQARVAQRPFDSHTRQANFALSLITTPWVLSLDADYILTPAFEQMLRAGEWDEECACYAPFRLCVRGRPLRASLYPPRAVLYAREGAVYEQDGHTQRLVPGRTAPRIPAGAAPARRPQIVFALAGEPTEICAAGGRKTPPRRSGRSRLAG